MPVERLGKEGNFFHYFFIFVSAGSTYISERGGGSSYSGQSLLDIWNYRNTRQSTSKFKPLDKIVMAVVGT